MYNILIVDDEEKLRNVMKDFFEGSGFVVEEAQNGKEALKKVESEKFDAIVMDIMMPVMDGIQACIRIRKISNIPIIMLTAKDEERDYIQGFNAGADDYIAKPFSNKILVEKIKALLKRDGKNEKKYDVGELKLNLDEMQAYFGGENLKLTATEFDLIYYFIENINIALSREKIIEKVWGYNFSGDSRTVDTHIKNLRKKLNNKYIETIRGYGYRFREEK